MTPGSQAMSVSQTAQKLSRAQRVRGSADFQAVYATRKSVRLPELTVAYGRNGLSLARLGLSVSVRNGNAVARNRIKRVFRAAFRQTRQAFPTGFDYVLIPQPKFKDYRCAVIVAALLRAAVRVSEGVKG